MENPAHLPARGRGGLVDPFRLARLALVAVVLLTAASLAETLRGDGCVVEYPAGERATAEFVAESFPAVRRDVSEWLGVPPAGRPRIVLAADAAGMQANAPGAPDWAVAVTRRDDVLVFRLDRVGAGGADSMSVVLRHETVHQVLTHLGGRPMVRTLPRWFEEGLCVSYAGAAYLRADTSVENLAASGNLPHLSELDDWFRRDASSAALAYRYGEVFVAAIRARFGDEALRGILRAIIDGNDFSDAFAVATGDSLARFEREWRDDVTPRTPFLLYLLLQNIELSLLVFGALLVFGGYVRWRLRRERALRALDVDVR